MLLQHVVCIVWIWPLVTVWSQNQGVYVGGVSNQPKGYVSNLLRYIEKEKSGFKQNHGFSSKWHKESWETKPMPTWGLK